MAKFELFKSEKNGQYYWRFKANNGKTVADGSEGYVNKEDAERGIEIVQTEAPNAEVDDQT